MEGYVLVVSDGDETWAVGPYDEAVAMAHRNLLWDCGQYSIQMVRYARPGNETRSDDNG